MGLIRERGNSNKPGLILQYTHCAMQCRVCTEHKCRRGSLACVRKRGLTSSCWMAADPESMVNGILSGQIVTQNFGRSRSRDRHLIAKPSCWIQTSVQLVKQFMNRSMSARIVYLRFTLYFGYQRPVAAGR